MIDYKIVGERIKKARKMKGLSQEELCKKIGFSVAFLSRVERASSRINLKRLSQICDILEVDIGTILSGTSNDTSQYLSNDFKEILEKCTNEQKKIIYEIAKTIIKN